MRGSPDGHHPISLKVGTYREETPLVELWACVLKEVPEDTDSVGLFDYTPSLKGRGRKHTAWSKQRVGLEELGEVDLEPIFETVKVRSYMMLTACVRYYFVLAADNAVFGFKTHDIRLDSLFVAGIEKICEDLKMAGKKENGRNLDDGSSQSAEVRSDSPSPTLHTPDPPSESENSLPPTPPSPDSPESIEIDLDTLLYQRLQGDNPRPTPALDPATPDIPPSAARLRHILSNERSAIDKSDIRNFIAYAERLRAKRKTLRKYLEAFEDHKHTVDKFLVELAGQDYLLAPLTDAENSSFSTETSTTA